MVRILSPEQIEYMAALTELRNVVKSQEYLDAEEAIVDSVVFELEGEHGIAEELKQKAERLMGECGFYVVQTRLVEAEDALIDWSHCQLKRLPQYEGFSEQMEVIFAGAKASMKIRDFLIRGAMKLQAGPTLTLLVSSPNN